MNRIKIIAVLQLICMLALLPGCALLDKGTYEKAETLFSGGNYGEAAALYEKIPDYADAADKLLLCENHIRYAVAAADFENGRYAGAAAVFGELGDFLDSADWSSLSGLIAEYGHGGDSGEADGSGGAVILPQDDYNAFALLIAEGAPGAAAKAAEVLAAIDAAAWAAARGENTVGAYEDYLTRWPDGAYRVECSAAVEALLWTEAAETDTAEGYLGYLSEYGDEAHAGEARDNIERLRESAYDEAVSENTVSALSAYLLEWPDTEHRAEIERLARALKADRGLSAPLLSDPLNADTESIGAFLAGYPGHVDEAAVRELLTLGEGDVAALLANGVISLEITGESITHTQLSVTNNARVDAKVAIPFGTYFAADSGSVQNMVVREEQTIPVPALGTVSVSVPSACMNIRRAIPDGSDDFSVKSPGEDARLTRLMRVLDENGCAYAVAQAAVWIVTDNPGDHALADTLVYSDGGRAISDADIALAKEMVRLASDT